MWVFDGEKWIDEGASSPQSELQQKTQDLRNWERDGFYPELDLVRAFLAGHIPALDVAPDSSMVCLYTLTPVGHFVIDRHPAHEQVVFASACSGHGFKFASVVGEILADLTTTGRATQAADFLRLGRLTHVPG